MQSSCILYYTYLCVCVRAYRRVHVSAGAERGKQHNVYCSSTLHFMTPMSGALAELRAGLAAINPRDPPVSASLGTGVIGARVTTHWLFMWVMGPRAYAANTLLLVIPKIILHLK